MKALPKYPTKAKPADLKKKKSFWKKPLLVTAVLFVGLILAFTDWGGDPASNNLLQGDSGNTAQPIEAVDNPNAAAQQATNTANSPTQSQPPSTTTPTTSKAGCDWRGDIPYKTVEKTTSSMAVGQVKVIDGVNGWHKVCTDEQGNTVSDTVTQEPTDKIIYYGTYTSEQALSKARSMCGGVPANSTFYADCVAREMNKQGWYYQDGQWIYR